tara:strand:- start:565 stop:840 length:276 start_codon:yes stop_codon:yes gene_type:complete
MLESKRPELIKLIRPIIMNSWNFNNTDQCGGCVVNIVYLPDEFDYLKVPVIRFTLAMKNGRIQECLNCDKYFVEYINDIVAVIYRHLCKDM